MSGDETDHCGKQPIAGQRKFLVVRPGWRSQEVTRWLRVIDGLYTIHRFSLDGRATCGNWVRHRIDSDRVSWDTLPVSGLPENFYDSTWLEGLSERERDSLEVQRPVDLKHSAEVTRWGSNLSARVATRSDNAFRAVSQFLGRRRGQLDGRSQPLETSAPQA